MRITVHAPEGVLEKVTKGLKSPASTIEVGTYRDWDDWESLCIDNPLLEDALNLGALNATRSLYLAPYPQVTEVYAAPVIPPDYLVAYAPGSVRGGCVTLDSSGGIVIGYDSPSKPRACDIQRLDNLQRVFDAITAATRSSSCQTCASAGWVCTPTARQHPAGEDGWWHVEACQGCNRYEDDVAAAKANLACLDQTATGAVYARGPFTEVATKRVVDAYVSKTR